MSRVSNENNTLLIIPEGLPRQGFYYYETQLCTIPTDPYISHLIQQDVIQANLYRKMERK